ncbi:hypothetical protein CL622_01220 [archaeon]|nr:hypothetical protein [archaeon]|tara:strand:- start:787 stop:1338 length:552 start_codon:yes stop_codon:yes gene_type:complete
MKKLGMILVFVVLMSLPIVLAECESEWNCTTFALCQGGSQERVCNDLQACGDASTSPPVKRICVGEILVSADCVADWQCSGWSLCNSDQLQLQRCIDLNGCGDESTRPSEQIECIPEGVYEVSVILLAMLALLLVVVLVIVLYIRRLQSKVREQERTFFIPEGDSPKREPDEGPTEEAPDFEA